MVLPEGASRGPDRTSPRKGAIGLIVFVLAATAGLVFLSLTSPGEPEATPTTLLTTTTTGPLDRPIDFDNFSVDQIATGEPLDFQQTASIDGLAPHSVVEHDGVLFVFGAEPTGPFGSTFQLSAWRSFDGQTWESLGEVLPSDHYIQSIQSTPQGLLAVGGHEDQIQVWLSQDGVVWTSLDLPSLGPGRRGSWGTATANIDTIAIAINSYIDPGLIVQERFLAHLGIDAIPDGMWLSWNHGIEDVRFELVGPFELRFATVNATDLGVTEEERAIFDLAVGPGDNAYVIATNDRGATWQEGSSEAQWMEGLYLLPDDSLLARGYGSSGSGTFQSFDGVTWSRVSGQEVWNMTNWRDGMVGLIGDRNLNLSFDGLTWESTTLGALIPARLNWWNAALAGGDGGIATAMVAERQIGAGSSEPPQPLTIEREGFTFHFNPYDTNVEAALNGEIVHQWGPFVGDLAADFVTGEIDFLDDEGNHLATFTMDEILSYQSQIYSEPGEQPDFERHIALAFSPDGENWTLQPPPDGVAEDAFLASMEVTGDMVIALISNASNPWVNDRSGFTIWSAPIP